MHHHKTLLLMITEVLPVPAFVLRARGRDDSTLRARGRDDSTLRARGRDDSTLRARGEEEA